MPNWAAEIAVGATGLDGYADESSRQSVRYPSCSAWGQRLWDTTYNAEVLLGKFVIGVIAASDTYGSIVKAMDLPSRPGVRLSVNWFYVVCLTPPEMN